MTTWLFNTHLFVIDDTPPSPSLSVITVLMSIQPHVAPILQRKPCCLLNTVYAYKKMLLNLFRGSLICSYNAIIKNKYILPLINTKTTNLVGNKPSSNLNTPNARNTRTHIRVVKIPGPVHRRLRFRT